MVRPIAALALPLPLLACAMERHSADRMHAAFDAARAGLTAAAAPARAAPATPVVAPPAIAPGPRRRGAAPPRSAAALMGSDQGALARLLGEPALRRAEGDAEIWLYEAPSCRLDLVLYPEAGRLRVAHAAARAHDGAEGVTEAACLDAIADAPATRPWIAPVRDRQGA